MAVGLEVLEFNEEFKKGQMAATTSVSAGASEVAYNNNSSFDDDGDGDEKIEGIRFEDYRDESQLEHVMSLVGRDLSEPYSGE